VSPAASKSLPPGRVRLVGLMLLAGLLTVVLLSFVQDPGVLIGVPNRTREPTSYPHTAKIQRLRS